MTTRSIRPPSVQPPPDSSGAYVVLACPVWVVPEFPEIDSVVHYLPEEQSDVFWLAGSQQFQLMRNVSESLAGRVAVLQLLGLSRQEIMGNGATQKPFLPTAPFFTERARQGDTLSLKDLYTLIWKGSFPALTLDASLDRDLFFSSYVQTYLQRDARDLAQVCDEMVFLRFLRGSAARTGQLLNISGLARDADVSPVTGKKWLFILEASGLIYLLEPFFTNVTKRMVKTPKLYFLDTGLVAYLTEWSSPETLEAARCPVPFSKPGSWASCSRVGCTTACARRSIIIGIRIRKRLIC